VLSEGNTWGSYYSGFHQQFGVDAFPGTAMHESRHSWQYTLKVRLEAEDEDDDHLFNALRPTSADLLDAPNAAVAPGGNGDSHFRGINSPDDAAPVNTMLEHNAMRFSKRIGKLEFLGCGFSGLSVFSGNNQAGPPLTPLPFPLVVTIEARETDSTGSDSDRPLAGVTVRFTVMGTASVAGVQVAYAMTDANGQALVSVTNGTADSQIDAEGVQPMMTPPSECEIPPSVRFTVRVGS
jgi:hypothetical protein